MKIALCLSGHARTYDQTYKYWKKYLFEHHDVDTFIHTWDTIGPRWFGEDRVENFFPLPRADFHSGIIESPVLDISSMRNIWNPIAMVVEEYSKFHKAFATQIQPILIERNRLGIPEGFGHHHPLSVRSMLYKRWKCNELKNEYELLTGHKYELVIQCRPDVVLTQGLLDEITTDRVPLYFHNCRSLETGPEIVDFGSIGSSQQVDFYCDLYNKIDGEFANVGEDFFEFLNPHRMYVKYFNRYNVPYVERDLGLCILRNTGIVLGWPHSTNIIHNFAE